MLDADSILAANDIELASVEVPEWGGSVYIRVMSGAERDQWEQLNVKALQRGTAKNVRAGLAALCMCDHQGKRLFTDDQIEALGKKSAKALDRVFAKIQEVNALTDDELATIEGN